MASSRSCARRHWTTFPFQGYLIVHSGVHAAGKRLLQSDVLYKKSIYPLLAAVLAVCLLYNFEIQCHCCLVQQPGSLGFNPTCLSTLRYLQRRASGYGLYVWWGTTRSQFRFSGQIVIKIPLDNCQLGRVASHVNAKIWNTSPRSYSQLGERALTYYHRYRVGWGTAVVAVYHKEAS